MASSCSHAVPALTVPRFEEDAVKNALEMLHYSTPELEDLLRINARLAAENHLRYYNFCSDEQSPLPAIFAYTGVVFKQLHPQDFTDADLRYAQDHLRITSFLYGLLRPLDGIKPYRMEGDVCLPSRGGKSMFDFWKPLLTDCFIADIKAQGGVLINLASGEMKALFDWDRVESSVKVFTPEFQVWKNGRLSTVVMYAKMGRGALARFILKNRIQSAAALKRFTWEGFAYDSSRSTERTLKFTLL